MITETMPSTLFTDFLHYLSTGEDPHGTVSPELSCEFVFPHQHLRTEGKSALDQLRARVSDVPWVLRVQEVEPTLAGFVAVVEYDAEASGTCTTYLSLNVVTTDGQRITGLAHWCSGAL